MKVPLTSIRWNISRLHSEGMLSNVLVPLKCTIRKRSNFHDPALHRIIDIGHKTCVALGQETYYESIALSHVEYTHY